MGEPHCIERVPDLAPSEVAEQPVVAEGDFLAAGLHTETRCQDILDQDVALVQVYAGAVVVLG